MRSNTWIATVVVVTVVAGAATGWRSYRSKVRLRAEVRAVRVRAEQGDAEAEAKLGSAYVRGRGVPQDYNEALRWYRRSAEHGSAHGDVGLGAAYYYGYGVAPDNAESLRWYRKAADRGNAAGEAGLGYLYEHADGVAQDYAEALRWYRKAADQGDARVTADLGGMYYYGHGVSMDYAEAVRWYRNGANRADPRAEYDLGYMYFYGKGVPQNRWEANRWFGRAADAGDERALRLVTPSFTAFKKIILLLELLGGVILFASGPWRLNFLMPEIPRGTQSDRAAMVAGLFVLLGVGLRWYGYTHFLLRRLGPGMNTFTYFKWFDDLAAGLALIYVARMGSQQRQEGLFDRAGVIGQTAES